MKLHNIIFGTWNRNNIKIFHGIIAFQSSHYSQNLNVANSSSTSHDYLSFFDLMGIEDELELSPIKYFSNAAEQSQVVSWILLLYIAWTKKDQYLLIWKGLLLKRQPQSLNQDFCSYKRIIESTWRKKKRLVKEILGALDFGFLLIVCEYKFV